jgi:hypothetical protein
LFHWNDLISTILLSVSRRLSCAKVCNRLLFISHGHVFQYVSHLHFGIFTFHLFHFRKKLSKNIWLWVNCIFNYWLTHLNFLALTFLRWTQLQLWLTAEILLLLEVSILELKRIIDINCLYTPITLQISWILWRLLFKVFHRLTKIVRINLITLLYIHLFLIFKQLYFNHTWILVFVQWLIW